MFLYNIQIFDGVGFKNYNNQPMTEDAAKMLVGMAGLKDYFIVVA